MFPGIRDCSNDPLLEDEDDMGLDENTLNAESPEGQRIVDDEVLSVSPLQYAMEMLSPIDNPYRDPILSHEVDLYFSLDFEENEKAELRKSQGIVSCAGLASDITSEEIMWMVEYYNLFGRWMSPRTQMRMHDFLTQSFLHLALC